MENRIYKLADIELPINRAFSIKKRSRIGQTDLRLLPKVNLVHLVTSSVELRSAYRKLDSPPFLSRRCSIS